MYFKPYGGVRWSQESGGTGPDSDSATRRSYTGQYEETSQLLGSLMHYKARYYSPFLHRFTQPDTIVPGAGNPQNLNRYLYTNGNPTTLNDPTGHCPWCIGAAIGAVVGAAIVGGIYAANNWGNVDGWELATAMGTGALAGGLIGSGVGAIAGAQLAGTALAGTAATAATTVINAGAGAMGSTIAYTALSGEGYDSGEAALNTLGGAVTGTVSGGLPYGPQAATAVRAATYIGVSEVQYAISSARRGEDPTWEGAGIAFVSGATGVLVDDVIGHGITQVVRGPMAASSSARLLDPQYFTSAGQSAGQYANFWGGIGLFSGTVGSAAMTKVSEGLEQK